MEVFTFIAEVGAPIAGALIMAFFIFTVLKQILDGVIDQIETLTSFCKMLEDRARVMNNDIVKIDLLISQHLELKPDLERVARAENFVEDGSIDARRD